MSKHFSLQEMLSSPIANRLGIANLPSLEVEKNLQFTMAGLERIRAMIDRPMTILSGYRCAELNLAVGGSHNSQHLDGLAADFVAPEYGTPRSIAKTLAGWVDILGIDQLILESTWVHVSFSLDPRGQILTKAPDGSYQRGVS